MDAGTKGRTAARFLASVGTILAVWKVIFEGVLAAVGGTWIAAFAATVIACVIIVIDACTTYFNNDYTEEAMIGTATTRRLKERPDLPVLVDVDEYGDDDSEEDPEEFGEADEVIEEGEE